MTKELLHPGLGSGALITAKQIRDALKQITSDDLFNDTVCEKLAAALSLSSPIEPQPGGDGLDVKTRLKQRAQASSEIREALTLEEVKSCLWTRSDGSPDPAATTSRLNNLLRKRMLAPSRQGAAKRVEG